LSSFFSKSFSKTIHRSSIFNFNICSFSTRLHHKFSSNSIKGERYSFTGRDYKLSKEESFKKTGLLLTFIVSKNPTFTRIITSEIKSSINEDS
jgi:hypothetical protein